MSGVTTSFSSFSIATENHKRMRTTITHKDHALFVDAHGVLDLLYNRFEFILQFGVIALLWESVPWSNTHYDP